MARDSISTIFASAALSYHNHKRNLPKGLVEEEKDTMEEEEEGVAILASASMGMKIRDQWPAIRKNVSLINNM